MIPPLLIRRNAALDRKPLSRSRLARLAATLVATALLAGCSASTGPSLVGDSGGNHLIAYSSDRSASVGQHDIFLFDVDNLGFRATPRLNSNQDDSDPALSSDGRFIAFVSARSTSGLDLYLYDRAKAAILDLPGVNSVGHEREPTFSGDALKLAFARDTLGFTRLRLLDGRNLKLLPLPGLDTTATYSDLQPSPNYSASRIAFVSTRLGSRDVFIWDQSARGVLDIPELRSAAGDDVEPSLTPDGRYVCFASDRAGGTGGYDLYFYDLMDRLFVPLVNVNTASNERNPSLGAGGFVISFESDRAGGLGGIDIWNHSRGDGRIGQAEGLSSSGSDLAPSVRWP